MTSTGNILHAVAGARERFESSPRFRVATSPPDETMNRKPRTHVNSTVNRDQDGSIRYITVRAEYFLEDVDAHENDENKFTDGVSAKFRFDVSETESGTMATLHSAKDIDDGAKSGYDTSLQFMKAVPIAEDAVMNIPGVDEVDSTEGYIMSELDRGRNAV